MYFINLYVTPLFSYYEFKKNFILISVKDIFKTLIINVKIMNDGFETSVLEGTRILLVIKNSLLCEYFCWILFFIFLIAHYPKFIDNL